MTNHQDRDNRRPDEIEDDIERTRAEVSSTIDAIQSKLTPGQLMDQAVAYLRSSGPAGFGANLGNTIRDNPVPVALVGIGVAWLAMSAARPAGARIRRRRASYGYGYDSSDDSAWAGVDGGVDDDGAFVAAGDFPGTGALHGLKDRASEIGHRMGDLGSRSRMRVSQARDELGDLLEEQPLVVGAIGVAIGAALGAALPRTRREDALMGRTWDDLVESATRTAHEQAEVLKDSAQRVAQTAQQEVDRMASQASQGGMPYQGAASPSVGRGAGGNGHVTRPQAAPGGSASDPGRPGAGGQQGTR